MNEELIEKQVSVVAEYQPFYSQLSQLEQDNQKVVFDYETPKGNKEARSHVYKLRQTKGALEKTRKEAKAESLRIGRAVDSEAADIEKRIEAMIAVHQAKIDEIEKRETDRIAAITARVASIENYGTELSIRSSIEVFDYITELEHIAIDDSFAEFAQSAAKAKDARLLYLRAQVVSIREKEDAIAEIERLRTAEKERAQAEHEAKIVAQALERAKIEAEQKAAEESKKAAQVIAETEAKAKADRDAAERRELELKLAAENAERRRVEAEQKAISDAKEAEVKAEKMRLKAIQDEQDRVAAKLKYEAEEAQKRERNKAHVRKINLEALEALMRDGISEEDGKKVISLIAQGKVPNVSIIY